LCGFTFDDNDEFTFHTTTLLFIEKLMGIAHCVLFLMLADDDGTSTCVAHYAVICHIRMLYVYMLNYFGMLYLVEKNLDVLLLLVFSCINGIGTKL